MWQDRLLSLIMVGLASQSQIPLISQKWSALLLTKDSSVDQLPLPKNTIINHKKNQFYYLRDIPIWKFLKYLSSEQLIYENFILSKYYNEVYNKKCCLKISKNCLNPTAPSLRPIFQNLGKYYSP